jgi:uncharacterized membrane protein YtjA (UPF0391 family)
VIVDRQPVQRTHRPGSPAISQEVHMLYYALVFFIVAIIAGVLGFGGIAGAATGIAKILFLLFIVLFLVSLIFGGLRRF